MLKRKIVRTSAILLFILVFTASMTAVLFCQTYSTSYQWTYDYTALGDSYSAGQNPYGIADGYSYADFIKDELKSSGVLGAYHKKGVSGYTTEDVLAQLRSIQGNLFCAEIVTMDIGINDILQLEEVAAYRMKPSSKSFAAAQAAANMKIPETESNIREIIHAIKDANPYFDPQIYVMGYFNAFPDLPEFLPIIERLNTAIRNTSTETGVTYIDTVEVIDKKIQDYLPGDIHPSVEGYKAIGREFWKSIEEDFPAKRSAYQPSNDIRGHWAENSIKKYAEQGIVAGYEDGSFKPEAPITRAEFVAVINQYFRLSAITEIHFTDVPKNAWYKKELQKAVEEGYIVGCEGRFRPDERVTRLEAAVMIVKIMKFDLSAQGNQAAQFIDGAGIPLWGRASVDAAVERGILKGYPDHRIGYQGMLTRAEALSLIDNITVYIYGNAPKG